MKGTAKIYHIGLYMTELLIIQEKIKIKEIRSGVHGKKKGS